MHSVGVDGISEVSADGAGSSFFRVGSAHQLTVQSDSVFAFQNLNNNRAGDHESNQVAEETTSAVLSVEAFSFSFGQLLQFRSYNAQACFSKRVVISPMTFFATASGLMMEKVR